MGIEKTEENYQSLLNAIKTDMRYFIDYPVEEWTYKFLAEAFVYNPNCIFRINTLEYRKIMLILRDMIVENKNKYENMNLQNSDIVRNEIERR